MNPYLVLLFLFFIGILQSTLSPFLSFARVHVDLLPMFILAWSLLRNFTESLIWAFLGGIILDVLATAPFGIFTVSLLIMAILANFWHERLFRSSFILPILLALPYSILFNLCGLVFMQLLDYNLDWGSALRNIVFPAGLMNVIAMVFIFPLLSALNNFIEREGLTIEN